MTEIAIHRRDPARRMGFFTDTTVCIGCKACEVACKQWNDLPADGPAITGGKAYDYTGALSAATWRHVHFVELPDIPATRPGATADAAVNLPDIPAARPGATADAAVNLPDIPAARPGATAEEPVDLVEWAADGNRWVFMSDVCKHCTNAGCLDACPTGALIRTEFQTVIVQPDVCNGCGYCVPSCPFGVIDRDPYDGRAAKCTLCYDRLQDGLEPACAKTCPTDSIQFGPWEELVERARDRVEALHDRGLDTAYLYGVDDEPAEQLAGNLGSIFLLTEPPERFGLPAHADSPIQQHAARATAAGLAAAFTAAGAAIGALLVSHRRRPR